MQAAAFKVILKEVFSESRLIKGGWQIEEQDVLYSKVKNEFKYFYSIVRYGKIALANIQCVIASTDNRKDYEALGEFNFERAWSTLWGASFFPGSVEILLKNNIMNNLLEAGFKPAVIGVIEFKGEYQGSEQDISYYYPAPEHENLFKIVDENPMDAMNLIEKLRLLGILQSNVRTDSFKYQKSDNPMSTQKNMSTPKQKVILNTSNVEIEDHEDIVQVMTLKEFINSDFHGFEKYYGETIPENILGIAEEDIENSAVFFKTISYNGNILEE